MLVKYLIKFIIVALVIYLMKGDMLDNNTILTVAIAATVGFILLDTVLMGRLEGIDEDVTKLPMYIVTEPDPEGAKPIFIVDQEVSGLPKVPEDTPEVPKDTPAVSEEDDGLSTELIVLIVLGVLALIGLVSFFLWNRSKQASASSPMPRNMLSGRKSI